jgi:hypothetical protein
MIVQKPHLAQDGPASPEAPPAPPYTIRRIPDGGSQLVIEKQGNTTTITSAALPPDVWRMVRTAERSAFGLMGLFAAIIFIGPFVRMIARRMERREMAAPSPDVLGLRQQIEFLQTSVDTMSVELERISESQRFQSRLLFDGKAGDAAQAQNAAPGR